MGRVVASLLVIGLVLIACSSGTVDDAENCTELTQAMTDIDDMTNDELERAGYKAEELGQKDEEGGDEWNLCVEVLRGIALEVVERIFDARITIP